MSVAKAYDQWAATYDEMENKTRDMEAIALKEVLGDKLYNSCIEVGCGTGKNTAFLLGKTTSITAVDFSKPMLEKAQAKINHTNVKFVHADILEDWDWADNGPYDLITFSLILEHVKDIKPTLKKAADLLTVGGHIYIGELHPYRQYNGGKAKYETSAGTMVVDCHNHHISEFTDTAWELGMQLEDLNEYFNEGEENGVPQLIAMIFTKK